MAARSGVGGPGDRFAGDQLRLAEDAERRAAGIVAARGRGAPGGGVAWPDLDDWEDVGAEAVATALMRRGRRRCAAGVGPCRPRDDLELVTTLVVGAALRRRAAALVARLGLARGGAEAGCCVDVASRLTPSDVVAATLEARVAAAARRRRRFAGTATGLDMAAGLRPG